MYKFITLTLLTSLLIDIVFSELPQKIHPVIMIGSLINFFKNKFININNRWSGFLTSVSVTFVSSVILIIILKLFYINNILYFILYSVILSSTFSFKMLVTSANDIKNVLVESIDEARKKVSYLVSRNTEELSESFIVSATIESMSENITDSYVAPVFYFIIMSLFIHDYNLIILAPFIYRIFNTLDAMLGYKNDELLNIGYFPAKTDDVLNYIPSRISGFLVVVSALILRFDWKNSYKIMIRDARNCPSPNSGYTMAPTAGALNIQLVKKNTYILGDDTVEIDVYDISKAVKLTVLTMILFTLLSLLIVNVLI